MREKCKKEKGRRRKKKKNIGRKEKWLFGEKQSIPHGFTVGVCTLYSVQTQTHWKTVCMMPSALPNPKSGRGFYRIQLTKKM